MKKKTGFQEIPITNLTPNPWNPRRKFAGEAFDQLVASVDAQGVLEPILVRPFPDHARLVDIDGWPNHGRVVDYQVVAGERRFRARYQVALNNGGLEGATIPAIVRALTDDEAFDIMTIENLQRENLNELEEARNFQLYLERHGAEAVPELAQRVSCSASYIRRRVRVLGLPKGILTAWEKGRLKYGHLEQLCRLKGAGEIRRIAGEIFREGWGGLLTVSELKQRIDTRAPRLDAAVFDLAAAGCLTCVHNSEVQGRLFAMDQPKDATCAAPACFKQHTNAWLLAHWAESDIRKECKTNGFRFRDDLNYDDYEHLYSGNQFPKCRLCPHKITIIDAMGRAIISKACLDPACHAALSQAKRPGVAVGDGDGADAGEGPRRVAWHGEHFRDIFFKEQIQLRFDDVLADKPAVWDDHRTLRLMYFGLLCQGHDLDRWFADRHDLLEADEYDPEHRFYFMPREKKLAIVLSMDKNDLRDELAAVAIEMALGGNVNARDRRQLGDLLGADLAQEWRITPAYLQKKTIAEILDMGHALGIFEDPAALAYLAGTLKRKTFTSCKKAELIKVILESGADLTGKVPAEILAD